MTTSLDPPARLTRPARQLWRETLTQIMAAGTQARVDPNSLEAYVDAVMQQRACTEQINDDGYTSPHGKPHPLIDVRRQATQAIATLAGQWGLNSRPRPTPPPAATTPMNDPEPNQGRWCDQHQRWECTASRNKGGQCHSIAVLGIGRCKNHAGVNLEASIPHQVALAQRRNPMAALPVNATPIEGLMFRQQKMLGEIIMFDEVIAQLHQDDITWGITKEVDDPGGVTTTREARVNTWITLRSQLQRDYVHLCEVAIRAGVEERMVRIAERDAAKVYKVMIAAFGDVGVRSDDPRIAEILPRRIRELTA